MRGLYCDGKSVVLRRDLPEPQIQRDEVLLRVVAVGICDTDLQLARGYMGFQGILGHEFLGLTAEGRRVTAEINNPCRNCLTCEAGRTQHCPYRTVLGILNHDGAMADLVAVPEANLHDVPSSIDDRTALLIEPLAAAFRLVEQARPGPGTRLAVLGDGKLGLLCAWVARATGSQVHLVGKHASKLDLAGPGITPHLLQDTQKIEHTFDLVVDSTGSATGLPTAIRLVRPCGTIVLKTTIAAPYEINLSPLVIDEITLLGSRCGPFPRAIQALLDREIDVKPLLGPQFSLDDAEQAFTTAGTPGSLKVTLKV